MLIEQNASMALSIADRGYVLETGKVVLTGTGKELLHNEVTQLQMSTNKLVDENAKLKQEIAL